MAAPQLAARPGFARAPRNLEAQLDALGDPVSAVAERRPHLGPFAGLGALVVADAQLQLGAGATTTVTQRDPQRVVHVVGALLRQRRVPAEDPGLDTIDPPLVDAGLRRARPVAPRLGR